MDRSTKERLARDNAYHQAALVRRAEMFEQEFAQRRLMLGLHRFHEFELMNMRKANTRESTRTAHSEGKPSDKTSSLARPKANLFRQVHEDGSEVAEPLYLNVVWVDADSGGLFKWTTEDFGHYEEEPMCESHEHDILEQQERRRRE